MAEDLERAALAVGVEDAAAVGPSRCVRTPRSASMPEHVAEVARHAEAGCDRVREVREAAREDVAADAVGVAEVDEACGAGLQAHAREGLVDDRDGGVPEEGDALSRLSAKVSFVPPSMAARVTEETSSPTP